MKTIQKTIVTASLAVATLFAFTIPSQAQLISGGYFHVDWQLNVPLNNGFSDKTSGWGMNFEGGYYLNQSRIGVGGFLAYHTNNEYIPWQTIPLTETASVTTDQQHTLFQLPFGLSGRYRLTDGTGTFDPYFGVKLGANFVRMTSAYSAYETILDSWGFYASPEIGTTIYLSQAHYWGIHLAAYYSYATNSSQLIKYSINGLNNFGIRVGVTF